MSHLNPVPQAKSCYWQNESFKISKYCRADDSQRCRQNTKHTCMCKFLLNFIPQLVLFGKTFNAERGLHLHE